MLKECKTDSKSGRPEGRKRKYSQEHIDYIAANIKGRPFKSLTAMFNKQFGMDLKVSAMVFLSARHGLHNGCDAKILPGGVLGSRTRFKKGATPWNKGLKGVSCGGKATQFKKGSKPANWVPIESERTNGNGYVDIKVAEGQKQHNWKGKHVIIWEKHHNRPVPPGHVIIFGDGNRRNFDTDNLLLVSRAQMARLNQKGLIQEDAELTKTGIIIADIYNKIGERKRGRR